MSSIFTKIINREIPAEIVYEDERTIAFLDIRPVSPGHLLVVPKQEVEEFHELDETDYRALMDTVRHLAKLLKEKLQPERVGVVVYGFHVAHAHIHLIPMNEPGKIQFDHNENVASEELTRMKEQLTDNGED